MNEQELKRHIERFKGRGRYKLELECQTTYTCIALSDRRLGFMLCETAKKSGLAKHIRLFYYADQDTEHVLFDSDAVPEERELTESPGRPRRKANAPK